jgi:hypothetical protein
MIKVMIIFVIVVASVIALASYPVWADDKLDRYTKAFEKGWVATYKREKIEEIPTAPKVVLVIDIDEDLGLDRTGFVDGMNMAGNKILLEKWNNYNWWEKITDPMTWFL